MTTKSLQQRARDLAATSSMSIGDDDRLGVEIAKLAREHAERALRSVFVATDYASQVRYHRDDATIAHGLSESSFCHDGHQKKINEIVSFALSVAEKEQP